MIDLEQDAIRVFGKQRFALPVRSVFFTNRRRIAASVRTAYLPDRSMPELLLNDIQQTLQRPPIGLDHGAPILANAGALAGVG